jgi:hypothetical protein
MMPKHGGTCNCMGCQVNEMKAHHMGYRVARKVFLLLIILVAFWFGTRFGEMRTWEYQIRAEQRMMMQQASMDDAYAPTQSAPVAAPAQR